MFSNTPQDWAPLPLLVCFLSLRRLLLGFSLCLPAFLEGIQSVLLWIQRCLNYFYITRLIDVFRLNPVMTCAELIPEPNTCLSSVNTSASLGLQITQTLRCWSRMHCVITCTLPPPLHHLSSRHLHQHTHSLQLAHEWSTMRNTLTYMSTNLQFTRSASYLHWQ